MPKNTAAANEANSSALPVARLVLVTGVAIALLVIAAYLVHPWLTPEPMQVGVAVVIGAALTATALVLAARRRTERQRGRHRRNGRHRS